MRPTPAVIFRALDDGAILVHLDDNYIFELNATATQVWMGLSAGKDANAIAQSLVATFKVDGETASSEVHALLGQLLAKGLIEP